MTDVWGRLAGPGGGEGPDYWSYFGGRLAELAAIPDGARLLDVGTGEGAVLLPAVERTGEHGHGVGIDLQWRGMKVAFEQAMGHNMKGLGFAQMDAAALGFADGVFGLVLSGFIGWDDYFDFAELEFRSPDIRLAEVRRVLRTGGRVGISSWERQEDLEWLGQKFQRYLPEYVADNEEQPGAGLMVYSKENAQGLEKILRQGGFDDIEILVETEEFISRDEERWWSQMWCAGWYEHIDRVACMEAGRLAWFKERVLADLQGRKSRQGLRFSKTVLFAFGTKP